MISNPLESASLSRHASSAWSSSAATAWLALLLPGGVQWSRGRRGRGLVVAWSYGGSLAIALALWGGWLSPIFLAVAVACQTLGWVDALKGSPFSGFTPVTVLAAIGGGLSAAVHATMLGLLCLFAWPVAGDCPVEGSHLVNRLAYRTQPPAPGDWVWLDRPDAGGSRAARVVAGGGQEVEWTGGRWTVDGRTVDVDSTRVFAGHPSYWRFRVPNDHVLIDSVIPVSPERPGAPWVMVNNRRIVGRIWARHTGFWGRQLL